MNEMDDSYEDPVKKLVSYMRSVNPKVEDHPDLIYGNKYHVWRGQVYHGVLEWFRDDEMGDSFQERSIGPDGMEFTIYVADRWELA